jgi:hypothetical protein
MMNTSKMNPHPHLVFISSWAIAILFPMGGRVAFEGKCKRMQIDSILIGFFVWESLVEP